MILWGLAGVALLASGITKVMGAEMMVSQLGDKTLWIGLIEIACVAALFLPATRNLGFFLCASYLGGVIATEWVNFGGPPMPGVYLVSCFTSALRSMHRLIWVTYWAERRNRSCL